MKYSSILLIAAILTLASSCQKEDPFTPEGHVDVFRCKVNGVEWTPNCISDPLFGCDPVDCLYYPPTQGVEFSVINISNDKSKNQSIGFSKYSTILGENEIPFRLRTYKDWNKNGNCGFYDLDTTSVRNLTILEVDTVKFLIKGTFEFTAIDHYGDCNDTVRITDGYFDVNYRF